MYNKSFSYRWFGHDAHVMSLIPPFHRGRRVPGHWPESRFVTSGHGPVSCLSSTDEFCPPSDKCSMSVRSNRRVLIKQNRPMTKIQRVWNSSSDVCSDEISGQWRFTHRLHRAPSADSDYSPATDLPHSHVMLSSHRRQDKSVIHRPLIGLSLEFDQWGTGSTAQQDAWRIIKSDWSEVNQSVAGKTLEFTPLSFARLCWIKVIIITDRHITVIYVKYNRISEIAMIVIVMS